jgi:phosphoribosylanthranilate isomerase
MFKIKICGITNVADALAAADAGADAIGLNFHRGSKRCVQFLESRRIVDAVGARMDRVGVFVDASADEIRGICRDAVLEWVQLHGNEPAELLKLLSKDIRVIRARRIDKRGVAAIANDIDACCDITGRAPDAVLVDAAAAGEFGGTGRTLDWKQLVNHQDWMGDVPLVVAGGLTPNNVEEAIRIVHPHAVDVASGVESAPGKKDAAKMREFVAAARAAFAAL